MVAFFPSIIHFLVFIVTYKDYFYLSNILILVILCHIHIICNRSYGNNISMFLSHGLTRISLSYYLLKTM